MEHMNVMPNGIIFNCMTKTLFNFRETAKCQWR